MGNPRFGVEIRPTSRAMLRAAMLVSSVVLILLGVRFPGGFPTVRAAQVPIIEMSVEAGFDGYFRDSEWTPVAITIRNTGDDFEGRLVVRPETSGAGIFNTYSAPVSLPSGAAQRVPLYITARGFTTQIRVELMDASGGVVTAAPAQVQAIQPLDQLFVVVSQSAAGSVDLSGAHLGNYTAYQANWAARDLPTYVSALTSVDAMLFADVDTSALDTAQVQAIEDWVLHGGHLIVAGGSNWQATTLNFDDILPLEPTGSETVPSLSAFADWIHREDLPEAETVVTVGRLREGADVLVAQAVDPSDSDSNAIPLLVRHAYGSGTVDFLALDPNASPLRGWGGTTELWLGLLTTTGSAASWAQGFTDWEQAARAVEILPGYNLLPDVLPLCGFLALYMALIGPLNYFVLARLNRRELAWVTIPVLIIVFSGLSYLFGFNLRGTEATVSRLSVVQAWPDGERATVDSLIGLLSPRRTQYTLEVDIGSPLRPVPRVTQGSLITSNVQASVDIQQTNHFEAGNFAVDASFVAAFNASDTITRPEVGGSASMTYDTATGEQRVRGSVRNDTEQTLMNPVILARGVALRLGEVLAPGDTEPFEVTLPVQVPPSPVLMSDSYTGLNYSSYYYSNFGGENGQTVIDILGPAEYPPGVTDDAVVEEDQRRRLFLASFITDYYSFGNSSNSVQVATGREDHVYLAGWVDEAPVPLTLGGAAWNSQDTTLYLIALDVETVQPTTRVTVGSGQFTWMGESVDGLSSVPPINVSLQPGDVFTFRFTPIPSAVLNDVDRLTVRMERANIGSTALPIFLYNWDSDAWEEIELINGEHTLSRPEPYLGPVNTVMVQVNADELGGYIRMEQLSVEQTGSY